MTESPASEASVFRVVRHVSWRAEGQRLLIYDVRRDVIYDGNQTALYAIERFDGLATLAEIARHLAIEFGIAPAVALADMVGFVEEMSELMLVERLT